MARKLPFLKPTPAKATLSFDVQQSILRLMSDAQALGRLEPAGAGVAYLEHCAADLRQRLEMAAQTPRSERA